MNKLSRFFHSTALLKLLLFCLVAVGLSGCSQLSLPSRNQGALQVTVGNNQALAVYLDDNHLGQTPFFDERIKVGNYTLKLSDPNSNNVLWQSNIKVSKRTLTVANFAPATNPEESHSEILYLEPLNQKDVSQLSISTLPDHVVVKIDGEVKGFSPLTLEDLNAGDHEIILEAPGYLSKTINSKSTPGHHLIIEAELGRDTNQRIEEQVKINEGSESASPPTATASATTPNQPNTTPSPTPSANFGKVTQGITQGYDSADEVEGPVVEILNATVGLDWLRVRETANGIADNEVARVQVGDFYPYVEDSDNAEWRQIEYAPGKNGWIALRFSRLIENGTN